MTVAVVVPFQPTDEHRDRALAHISDHYATHHPTYELIRGDLPEWAPWSKGAAVNLAIESTDADVLVLADADSYVDPPVLADAVRLVEVGAARWVVPHRLVHRLSEDATADVLAGGRARLTDLARRKYIGLAGGGIVVLTRTAYETVGGIDPRFLGWGGEDITFGWALSTLVGQHTRLTSPLVHLWHPHPAPNLRGSEESEALVAEYRAARGVPRLMRAVIAGQPAPPAEQLAEPVTFRSLRAKRVVRVGPARVPFIDGLHTTTDADVAEALRVADRVEEVTA